MESLFLQLLSMSLTGSYVIVFVIVARLLLRKVPKVFSYALWSVVLFRLVCPFSFESVFSLIPAKAQEIPLQRIATQPPQIPSGLAGGGQALNNLLAEPATAAASVVDTSTAADTNIWLLVGQYVWLFGIAVLLLYSIRATVRLVRSLKPAQQISGNIYEMKGLATPFVFGAIRPKIYLPAELGEHERGYILKHEQVHIKRLDHLIKPLAFAVLCIHWFNPLVWIAFVLMSEDMELSCDESVIRQLGSGIKKDYSTSLLTLSAGRRFIGGSPLAFGENNTKGRILNILNYRKPAFWVVILVIIAIAAVSVGLMSNPRQTTLTERDYAEQFIEEEIAGFASNEANKFKIVDSSITKFEKLAEFDNLMPASLQIWHLEYRLKPDDPAKVSGAFDLKDGMLIEEGSMGDPIMVFSYEQDTPNYLGSFRSAEYDISTIAGQETALRVFLEGKQLLSHETYSGKHILVKFPLTLGETSQLLLSQPAQAGDKGIWAVERWKDTRGNEYYHTPQSDLPPAEYYDRLQAQADEGEEAWLLDPQQVAIRYIKTFIGPTVAKDKLEVDYNATAADFAVTPESTTLGYVLNFSLDSESFDFDNVEWLTLEDSARFKDLNITEENLPGGFYILNKYTITDLMKVTAETKYSILDQENWGSYKDVTKQEFIEFLNQYSDNSPLCKVTYKDDFVTGISEVYLP
ncbi:MULTISPECIES: M56 family metallopeptidase [unclassified Paenibacillus]|uniref:M56 family metallopeptidase n=1 Tax=unclassified Paenibacillus TaxID=185978 RepID=UPI0030FAC92B